MDEYLLIDAMNFFASSSFTTMNSQHWVFPALGACIAALSTDVIFSLSAGSCRNFRIERLFLMLVTIIIPPNSVLVLT